MRLYRPAHPGWFGVPLRHARHFNSHPSGNAWFPLAGWRVRQAGRTSPLPVRGARNPDQCLNTASSPDCMKKKEDKIDYQDLYSCPEQTEPSSCGGHQALSPLKAQCPESMFSAPYSCVRACLDLWCRAKGWRPAPYVARLMSSTCFENQTSYPL